jgi:hypothetical protein
MTTSRLAFRRKTHGRKPCRRRRLKSSALGCSSRCASGSSSLMRRARRPTVEDHHAITLQKKLRDINAEIKDACGESLTETWGWYEKRGKTKDMIQQVLACPATTKCGWMPQIVVQRMKEMPTGPGTRQPWTEGKLFQRGVQGRNGMWHRRVPTMKG